MQRIQNWGEAMLIALTGALNQLLGVIPALLGAILILIVGWVISGVLGKLTAGILRRVGFEPFAGRVGFKTFLEKAGVERMDSSSVLGQAVAWTLRLVVIQMAADVLGLRQVTVLLNQMIAFIPNIFVAVLILMVAGFLGRLLQGVVRGAMSSAGAVGASLLDDLAYWAVMAFGIVAAMNQLNIAPVVVNTLFIGLVATIGLALALSFGLGGREVAAELTRRWVDTAQQAAPHVRQHIHTVRGSVPTPPYPAETAAEAPTRTGPADVRRRAA
ncbi:MAG: mechanosensitive ion channel family protein [Armatimonadota bacterium]